MNWKRIKRAAANILYAPLYILLIPVFIILLFFYIPALIVMQIKYAISFRRFRKREAGYVYLICTSKRNWHDFIKNNVIPVLPDNFRVVWRKPIRSSKCEKIYDYFSREGIGGAKPYLVVVTPNALLQKPLNSVLLGLKAHQKKSEATRQACAQIIAGAVRELQSGKQTDGQLRS